MGKPQLIKWKQDFEREAERLKTEYDTFFFNKKFHENYELRTDENNNTLSLVILNAALSHDIENRLTEIFLKTKPANIS